jgi:L-rhamnose-H+ transport protein
MGLLWGIGGLMYGLGVRYLGMSLGNSVILGFCSAFGSLIPASIIIMYQHQGKENHQTIL